MEQHKHRFINTGEYEKEVALVDYYRWECFDCNHVEFADDIGNSIGGKMLNKYGDEDFEQDNAQLDKESECDNENK